MKPSKIVTKNGLTSKEWKTFLDMVAKANKEQLNAMKDVVIQNQAMRITFGGQ